jgi:hypothetical protein
MWLWEKKLFWNTSSSLQETPAVEGPLTMGQPLLEKLQN